MNEIINFTIDDLSSNPINSIEEPSPRPTVEIDSSSNS